MLRLLSLSLLLSVLGFQTRAAVPEASEVRVIEPLEQDVVIKGTSEHNRINKNFGAYLTGGTFGPATVAGFGLQVFLDRNSLLKLDTTTGSPLFTDMLNTIFGGESKTQVTNLSVSYQRFFGNSFYVRAGADYRSVDYLRRYRNLFDNTFIVDSRFQGSALGALIVIGNEWQWSYFTLGVDWIGVSIPVSKNIRSESFVSTETDGYYYDIAQADKKTLFDRTWPYSLTLRLGASF